MALVRWSPRSELWDPFTGLSEIQDEMNRLFDTSLRRRSGLPTLFAPAIDVIEEKDHLEVRADLPGLGKDDVSVSLQENVLTIKGEKKQEIERKEANYYLTERSHGTFSRVLELPTAVDAKRIEARFKDGVLIVSLPKSEEAKPKQIEVKVN
jgi:HSP20 family protein